MKPILVETGEKLVEITSDGGLFDPDFIERSLLRLRRFSGRGNYEINVLHHSAFVALRASQACEPKEVIIACWLHDWHEAYVGDVITPVKTDDFKIREKMVQAKILTEVFQGANPTIIDNLVAMADPYDKAQNAWEYAMMFGMEAYHRLYGDLPVVGLPAKSWGIEPILESSLGYSPLNGRIIPRGQTIDLMGDLASFLSSPTGLIIEANFPPSAKS